MKTVKIAAIFMVVLMALSAVGIGYAHWRDSIYVNVTVNTGEVDVEWSLNANDEEVFSNDPMSDQNTGQTDPGLECYTESTYDDGNWIDTFCSEGSYVDYGKDVAYTHVWRTTDASYYPQFLQTAVDSFNQEEYNKLWIEFRRAYPSYAPMVSMWVDNIGTIPVYMEDLEIGFFDYDTDGWITGDAAGKALDDAGCELIAWCVTLDNEKVGAGTKGSYQFLPAIFDIQADEDNMGIFCMHNLVLFLKTVKLHPEEALDIHLIFHFQQHMEQDLTEENGNWIQFYINPTFCQYNLVDVPDYVPLYWP